MTGALVEVTLTLICEKRVQAQSLCVAVTFSYKLQYSVVNRVLLFVQNEVESCSRVIKVVQGTEERSSPLCMALSKGLCFITVLWLHQPLQHTS